MTSVDAKETQEKQVNAVPESKEPAPIATTEASEKAPAKQDEDEEEYNEDEDEEQNNTKNRLDESGNTQPKIDENWHQCINNELETPRNSDNLNKQNQPLYHGTRVRF